LEYPIQGFYIGNLSWWNIVEEIQYKQKYGNSSYIIAPDGHHNPARNIEGREAATLV
jgi:hypothetical protein